MPKTLEEYDNREFAMDDEADFSSLAYLIGLIRTLDFLFIGIPRSSDENINKMVSLTCEL
jgi:hypothetical protein